MPDGRPHRVYMEVCYHHEKGKRFCGHVHYSHASAVACRLVWARRLGIGDCAMGSAPLPHFTLEVIGGQL